MISVTCLRASKGKVELVLDVRSICRHMLSVSAHIISEVPARVAEHARNSMKAPYNTIPETRDCPQAKAALLLPAAGFLRDTVLPTDLRT